MQASTRKVMCEVCGFRYPTDRWIDNLGYCPNCDQPYGENARRLLDLPRMDLDPDEGEFRDLGEDPEAPGYYDA